MTNSLLNFFCDHLPAAVIVLSVADMLAFGYVSMGLRKLANRKEQHEN